jgi:hypothetical protein
MTVAGEIARQIGPGAFAMMGAKNLTDCGDALRWKMGGGARHPETGKAVTYVLVRYNAGLDLYDVEFIKQYRAPSFKVETLETVEGVYCDMLKGVIEDGTGFRLSL